MGAPLVISIAWRLDRQDAKFLRLSVVEDEVDDILGKRRADQQQRFGAGAHQYIDDGQQVGRVLNIKITEQDGGVIHGDAVRFFAAFEHGAGDSAAPPVHAFHVIVLDSARVPAAHIKLAMLADEVEDLAQLLRQFAVLADALCQLRQLLAARDGLCHVLQLTDDQLSALLQALTQTHGVRAGGDELQALIVYRLEDEGGGCCAVAAIFVELPEHLPQQHGAHIGIAIGQFADAARDETAFVQQFRRLVIQRLTDGDRARYGTERRAYRVDNQIDAALQAEGGIRLEDQAFSRHGKPFPERLGALTVFAGASNAFRKSLKPRKSTHKIP